MSLNRSHFSERRHPSPSVASPPLSGHNRQIPVEAPLLLAAPYQETLKRLQPFLVVWRPHLAHMNTKPMGLSLASHRIYDPTALAAGPFLELLSHLDLLAFGGKGMPMPKWVYYDCAEFPGAIFGFGTPRSQLTELEYLAFEEFLENAPPETFVPLSMFQAIPGPGQTWIGHDGYLNASSSLLGQMAFLYGVACLKIERLMGVSQWTFDEIANHLTLGPVQLRTAYTPGHSEPRSFTFVRDFNADLLRKALAGQSTGPHPEPDFWVDPNLVEDLMGLQRRIEAEPAHFSIASYAQAERGTLQVPMKRV